ncbi:F-box domain-containing protein [Mycena indigotica]|uniref:F-box domain-containing protein n=1 Tax=Mycena indigotica TaxID=2126181 RepID=A0A8H6SN76_9AGAR|nr:F-box domain-containing protein [Mycena indigotica]KAF7302123.1 F-box domain-containing protein [Mycena indigotica]
MNTEAIRNEIPRIETEIGHHKAATEILRQRPTLLTKQLQSNATFSIDALPPEILSEIFVQCLPPKGCLMKGEENPLRANSTSLVFAQVCSRWRTIAIQTPFLWTDIRIHLTSRQRTRGDDGELQTSTLARQAEKLHVLGQRSGSCFVNVKLAGNGGAFCAPDAKLLVTALQRCSARISVLEVFFGIEGLEAFDNLAAKFDLHFPTLHTLRLDLDAGFGSAASSHSGRIKMFSGSQRLRAIMLDVLPSTRLDLPWSQITHFRGQCYALSQCQQLLRLACNVESAYFSLFPGERELVPTDPLVHNGLKDLTICECYAPDEEPHVLEYFEFPSLRSFSLSSENADPDKNWDSDSEQVEILPPDCVSAFLRRSPSLQSLTLHTFWESHELDPLASLGITELKITTTSFVVLTDLFGRLGTAPFFLPKLTHLEVECSERFRHPWSSDFASCVACAVNGILRRNTSFKTNKPATANPSPITRLKLTSNWCFPDLSYILSDLQLADMRTLKSMGVDIYIGTKRQLERFF